MPAMVQLEGLGRLTKFIELIRTQTHDLPAYSIEPKQSLLSCAPEFQVCEFVSVLYL
jgi:hypothetical protein